MDKEIENAFKLLGNQISKGFDDVRAEFKQELESIKADMATKQDIESIKADMATKQDFKELKDELRTIVREEVQDIRDDMERRCSPAQTE